MNISSVLEQLTFNEYSKDAKLNLQSLCSQSLFDDKVTLTLLLTLSYTTREPKLISVVEALAKAELDTVHFDAARGAATVMAMNNMYYRFAHLAANKQYLSMPTQLRMNIFKQHGIDHTTFEALTFGVSVLNGCGLCIDSHEKQLIKAGYSEQQIQFIAKFAAVVNAVAMAQIVG